MNQFTSDFWSWYIIVLTLGSIAFCAWLLWKMSKSKAVVGALPTAAGPGGKQIELTGHVWDGDLAEYNNPLPRWWMWLFWITIAFGLVYLVLYPGLGNFAGILKWTSTGAYNAETAEADARLKPLYDKYATMELPAIASDPQGRAMGERIFLNNCAPCHGSDAGGGPGFPNLRDTDWLYGGAPEQIVQSITGGRMGVMPALGATIGEEGVKNVVAYVRTLSGLPADKQRAAQGKATFDTICAACHGPEGKGNQAIGAPNLTDNIWLYGSSEATIAYGVNNGRHLNVSPEHAPMPSFKSVLGPARINLVGAYVWSLSNKTPAGK